MTNSAVNTLLLTLVLGISGWSLVEIVGQGKSVAVMQQRFVNQDIFNTDFRLRINQLEKDLLELRLKMNTKEAK